MSCKCKIHKKTDLYPLMPYIHWKQKTGSSRRHSAVAAESGSALSGSRSEELSTRASAGSSGKAENVGTALNRMKPTVMTTNETMYRTENCGQDQGDRCYY